MVRFRAPTKFKKVGRLSRDGWHIFWCAIHDGSSRLMEPLNCFLILKTSQSKELYTRLCSPQRPPGLLSVALIFSFFSLSTFEANMSEWVRLWFGCFYQSEWECGVQGTVLKGGRGRGRCRPEERSVQKKKGLETKGRFWAQVRQEASEPHEGQEIKTAALSLSPGKRPITFKSVIFF